MTVLAFFGWLGWQEALLVLGIALVLFGRRIPGVARSLGRSIVEFRQGMRS